MAEDLERYNSSLTGAEVDVALQDMAQRISERYAKGTANGVPVTTGQIGYQDNAKYYAEQAKTDADRAESAVPIGTESAVLWTMAQDLTDNAKQVARTNIGAGNPLGTVAGGKNLLNLSNAKLFARFGTPIINGANSLYVTQSPTSAQVINVVIPCENNTDYCINATFGSGVFAKGIGFSDTVPTTWTNIADNSTTKNSGSGNYLIFSVQLANGSSVVLINDIIIAKGTQTAYEPFYPSNLQLERKQNIVNLLNCTMSNASVSGGTLTRNADGTYTVALNNVVASGIRWDIGTVRLNKGLYKVVGCPSNGGSSTARVRIGSGSSASFVAVEDGDGYVLNVAEDNLLITFGIAINKGATATLVFKPMITENLSATYDDFIEFGHYVKGQDQVDEITLSTLGNTYAMFGIGIANSTTELRVLIPLPQPFSRKPINVTFEGALQVWTAGTGITVTGLSILASGSSNVVAVLSVTTTGLTVGATYVLRANNNANTSIKITA